MLRRIAVCWTTWFTGVYRLLTFVLFHILLYRGWAIGGPCPVFIHISYTGNVTFLKLYTINRFYLISSFHILFHDLNISLAFRKMSFRPLSGSGRKERLKTYLPQEFTVKPVYRCFFLLSVITNGFNNKLTI